jgi:hypothetical protein
VKLQEINLLHIKLGVRYRRDMEIETELQTILFFLFRSSCFQTTQSPQKRFQSRGKRIPFDLHVRSPAVYKEINNTSLEKSNVRDTLQGLGFR